MLVPFILFPQKQTFIQTLPVQKSISSLNNDNTIKLKDKRTLWYEIPNDDLWEGKGGVAEIDGDSPGGL
mgnify:CR=1 FL=1